MVNGFEEEVRALEEYGHDCCARIDDRIHECCKRIREAREQELDNTRYAYEVSMALMKKQPSPVTYDVLGNERHKAVCELRKLPDGYPSYSAFPFAKWYEDLSTALGICKGEVSCAKVRDTLIHLLGGDQVPVTLGDLYGIWKGDGDGMDAGGCVEACGDCAAYGADGRVADSAGSQVSEGVAPITTELRETIRSLAIDDSVLTIGGDDFHRLCDTIDAVHAGLERENAELRERLAVLDNRSESMHIGSATVTITDELRKWAEGDALRAGMSLRTARDQALAIADRIDAEHERELAEQQDSLTVGMQPMTEENMAEGGWVRGPLDADGKMWRRGDMSDSNWGVIEGIAYEDGRWFVSGHDTSAPWIPADSIRHYHEPTVEDVLQKLLEQAVGYSDAHTTVALNAIAKYAKRLRLSGDAE